MGQLLRLHGEASAAVLLLIVPLLSLTPLLGVSLLILLIASRWHRSDGAVPIPAWRATGSRWPYPQRLAAPASAMGFS